MNDESVRRETDRPQNFIAFKWNAHPEVFLHSPRPPPVRAVRHAICSLELPILRTAVLYMVFLSLVGGPLFTPEKTPIEMAQDAFKLGKKLKRSAAVVRELLERVSFKRWSEGVHTRVCTRFLCACPMVHATPLKLRCC